MGLSKKQRLEKQKRHRVKQAEKARARKADERAAREAKLPRDISLASITPQGPTIVQRAACTAQAGISATASLATACFWTTLTPLTWGGRACEEVLGMVTVVEPLGLALFGIFYYLCVEMWQPSPSTDRKWEARMEKLENEVKLLRQQVKHLEANGVTVPAIAAAKPVTLRAAPPTPAPAPPPPPPMMKKRALPKPFVLKSASSLKKTVPVAAKAAAGPMSLATLLNAKSGLKSGSTRVLGPSKAKQSQPGMAISLADISNVQLKRVTKKSSAPSAPYNPSTPLVRHLRKTKVERSPGGTPMRQVSETSDSRTNLLSSALRNKFKTVRLPSPKSVSPSCGGGNENYLSPYAPRIR